MATGDDIRYVSVTGTDPPADILTTTPELEDADLTTCFAPFEGAPLAMLLVDRTGRILKTNSRLDTLFGYGPGELAGKPIETLLPPEHRQHHGVLVSAFFDYPTTRLMSRRRDLAGYSKSGALIPIEIGLTTAPVGEEELAVAWVFDLTERSNQDQLFRLVVDASPNGILLADEGGKITLCNQQACKLFGYSSRELLGQSVEALVPKRIGVKHRVYRSSFQEDPAQRSMGLGRDLYALRSDGSEFPIEIGLTPIETWEGRFTMATVIDISTRKQSAEQLQQSNEELMGFARGTSHDLKAPLSTILGLADIALEDLEDGRLDETQARLGDMRDCAIKLSARIENILALATAEHAADRWVTVDLVEIVAEVEEEFREAGGQAGVALIADLSSRPQLLTEPTRLRIVLRNLVSNAIKYSDATKSSPFVKISTHELSGKLVIEVSDNGVGIPEADRGSVFQMLQRFHPQHADGSGLGLAMVKKQVECLRGEIEFDSSPAGTVFRIVLTVKESK